MSFYPTWPAGRAKWGEWFGLGLMAMAAPLVAAEIHSLWVFHQDFRLYNAEIGGSYFLNMGGKVDWTRGVCLWVMGCGMPGFLMFCGLMPLRRSAWYRWLVWLGCVGLWTNVLFQMEFAIK